VGSCGLVASGSGKGPGEHGNEPSGSIKGGVFVDCRVSVIFSRSSLLHKVI
jgi:hypothetical protein